MIAPARSRPRNAAATRSAILNAARSRFLLEGYDQVGLRAIAGDAGVDAALICRYFGSKEGLFADVLASTSKDPMDVLAGDRATFGRRVAAAMLDPSKRSPERMAFIQLATRSSASPVASKLVRSHIESQFIVPFTAWLGDRCAAEKAWLTAAVLMGVALLSDIEGGHPSQNRYATDTDRLARSLQEIVDSP
ncbi:MAG: TetR/AcrR family transcriptional regulator [Gammaproteobacteria bacterium]|nr:TetR/AcrR family transcriptional regulator [Gammaproteobacteria bacterium]